LHNIIDIYYVHMKPPKRLSLCVCVINSECCVTELCLYHQPKPSEPKKKAEQVG